VQTGNNFESVAKLWLCNKKNWCYQCDHFSSVLEYLETKKLYLFPGCCLARDENALMTSSTDAKMLEDFDPPVDGGWLQQCNRISGEGGLDAEADQVDAAGVSGAGRDADGDGDQQTTPMKFQLM
jgi:hypothetical protein